MMLIKFHKILIFFLDDFINLVDFQWFISNRDKQLTIFTFSTECLIQVVFIFSFFSNDKTVH